MAMEFYDHVLEKFNIKFHNGMTVTYFDLEEREKESNEENNY